MASKIYSGGFVAASLLDLLSPRILTCNSIMKGQVLFPPGRPLKGSRDILPTKGGFGTYRRESCSHQE